MNRLSVTPRQLLSLGALLGASACMPRVFADRQIASIVACIEIVA